MNKRSSPSRLLALAVFLLLVVLGYHFGALHVREAGGGVVLAATELPSALMDPYLRVQMALASDKTATVKPDAGAIVAAATALGQQASPIVGAARELERASNPTTVRAAFGGLSDALLAYAKATGAQPPAGVGVAFCPMVQRFWMQKGSDIRNPYYGSAMLTCGELRK